MCLSDVLIAHNYQLQMWDSSAGTPLLYTPDPKLQKALLSFVVEHVFTSPEQDSHSSKGSLLFSFTENLKGSCLACALLWAEMWTASTEPVLDKLFRDLLPFRYFLHGFEV